MNLNGNQRRVDLAAPNANQPSVSIIIPCFRQAKYLSEAVDCCLGQTYPSVEVIVVNDGSDDDTERVAKGYGGRIQYIYQRNGGLSSARNTGIEHACGDYLLFLDADDRLDPNALDWLVSASNRREDALCVMGYTTFTDDPALDRRKLVLPLSIDGPFPNFIHSCFGPPNAFMVSKNVVRQVGGFAKLKAGGCEDWDLWLRVILAGTKLITIQKVGAFYRRYAGSMSNSQSNMLKSRCEVLLRLHRNLLRKGEIAPWGTELLDAEYRVMMRLLAHGIRDEIVGHIDQSIRELRRLGIRPHASMAKRFSLFILGYRGTLLATRLLDPETFSQYRNGYT